MVSQETRQKLDALNAWLAAVYGEGIRISDVLKEDGLTDDDIEIIKADHLDQYLYDVLKHQFMPTSYEERKTLRREIGNIARNRLGIMPKPTIADQDLENILTIKKPAEQFRNPVKIHEAREQNPRAYEIWSDEEDDYLIRFVQQGKTQYEIMQILMRGEGPIRNRMKDLTVEPLDQATFWFNEKRRQQATAPDKEELLRNMVATGKGVLEIAEHLDVSVKVVRRRIRKLDIPIANRQQFWTGTQFADQPARYGAPWEDGEYEEVLTLFNRGWSVEQIAEHFERTESSILSIVRRIRNEQMNGSWLIGLHSDDGRPIGAFPSPIDGPIIMHGHHVVRIPGNIDPNEITLEQAIELLNIYS